MDFLIDVKCFFGFFVLRTGRGFGERCQEKVYSVCQDMVYTLRRPASPARDEAPPLRQCIEPFATIHDLGTYADHS